MRLYFDSHASLYWRRLPHWRRDGATYFVTWRLRRGQADLDSSEMSVVFDAMHHFDRKRYDLFAGVVMNDHAHAILRPYLDRTLEDVLHSWKSFTVRMFHRQRWRCGSVWQDESFDRIIRSESDLDEKIQYIFTNPWKRWPLLQDYDWVFPNLRVLRP